MKLATKFIIAIALVYNGFFGYFVVLTANYPIVVLGFLAIDFLMIFYYMRLLIRLNIGYMRFERTHKELLEMARAEVRARDQELAREKALATEEARST